MRIVLSCLGGLLLFLLAISSAAAQSTAPDLNVSVDIRREKGAFTATFHFPGQFEGWAFLRSNRARRLDTGWRQLSWKVVTRGVELRRIGETDVLIATDGTMPKRVEVHFAPFGEDLAADYDPALIFTDGTVGLFTGHFLTRPWSLVAGVQPNRRAISELRFRDGQGPLTYRGASYSKVDTQHPNTYVLFGRPQFLTTPHLTALIDPQTPAWMKRELTEFLPRTFALYEARLGARSGDGKPMVLSTWAGPTPKMISRGGSVLPGLLTIRLEGEGMLSEAPEELQGVRWFIAHEAAHFWLGDTVRHAQPADAWISEGGATMLGYRLIQQIDPSYEPGASLGKDWADCVELAKDKPLSGAALRREYRAHYACGALFAMIAEGAAQRNGGRDFFDFVAALVAANRADAGGDRVVTVEEWLGQVTAESGDATVARDLRLMLDTGVNDPASLLCSMLVRVRRRGSGCEA